MLVNVLHWLAIAAQVGNVVLGVVPGKYQPYAAGSIAIAQYVVHLLDGSAPSIGVSNGTSRPKV